MPRDAYAADRSPDKTKLSFRALWVIIISCEARFTEPFPRGACRIKCANTREANDDDVTAALDVLHIRLVCVTSSTRLNARGAVEQHDVPSTTTILQSTPEATEPPRSRPDSSWRSERFPEKSGRVLIRRTALAVCSVRTGFFAKYSVT